MRLSRFIVRNFKGIDSIECVIPPTDEALPGSGEFLSIVGENNVGKSSILQALQLALPSTDINSPDEAHFPGPDPSNGPIEVELEFVNLSDNDREKQGVRTHIYAGKYRIKKQWESVGGKPRYFAYRPDYDFPDWFTSKRKKMTFVEKGGAPAEEIVGAFESEFGELDSFNKENKSRLKKIAIDLDSPLVEVGEPSWQEDPGGFKANVDSVLPRVIFIPAIQDPAEEVATSRKTSSVGQIVNNIFDQHLLDHEVVERFREQSERVETLFSGEGKDSAIKQVEEKISEKIQRMIDIEATLNFDSPDVTRDLAGRTELELVHEGVQTKPEHQGHGAQRALVLSLLEIIAEDRASDNDIEQSLLLLIEEPEIYMHPQMLRRMRDVLLDIARQDTAQVIATTHSPVFLDLANRHEGILIVNKPSGGGVQAKQRPDDIFEQDETEEQKKRLRMILDFDPAVNEVFFSDRVCLVEGDTERAAMEAIARKLESQGEIDWKNYLDRRRKVSLVNCRGKWNICAFQRVLNGFEIDYLVVHDLDGYDVDERANARISDLHHNDDMILRHDEDLEDEFFSDSWSRDKPWRVTQELQDSDELPDSAIEYFEFILGRTIEDLQ